MKDGGPVWGGGRVSWAGGRAGCGHQGEQRPRQRCQHVGPHEHRHKVVHIVVQVEQELSQRYRIFLNGKNYKIVILNRYWFIFQS
jgi:hypothetical protein